MKYCNKIESKKDLLHFESDLFLFQDAVGKV